MDNCHRSQEASGEVQHADRPMDDGRPRICINQRWITVSHSRMFTRTTVAVQIWGNLYTHCSTEGNTTVRYRKLSISLQLHKLVASLSCTQIETTMNRSTCPSTYSTHTVVEQPKVPQVWSGTLWKSTNSAGQSTSKSLYLNDLLLKSIGLFQKRLIRTAKNIEDLCFYFLGSEQTQRNVEERDL